MGNMGVAEDDGPLPGRPGRFFAIANGCRSVASAGLRTLLDLLLPPTCIACGHPTTEEDVLCPACWSATPFLEPPWCARLGRPFAYDLGPGALCPEAIADPPVFDRARAAAAFAGPARDLVHGLKYGDRPAYARAMGRWMARAGAELLAGEFVVVPVPLHRIRLWRRRFNQAALLAKAVAETAEAPLCLTALQRIRSTRQQVGLNADARAENVRGAFQVTAEGRTAVVGRRVVLVDDVYTTGATVSACTLALRRGGAVGVDVLTFARADGDNPLS